MGRPSKEFHEFDSLMGKLLTVPKATIHERMTEHREMGCGPQTRTQAKGTKKR